MDILFEMTRFLFAAFINSYVYNLCIFVLKFLMRLFVKVFNKR